MTLLVFGKTGQVGVELARLSGDILSLGREEADLRDPVACAKHIAQIAPDAVINAAAYTAVDKAEAEPELARIVNADAPAAMAAEAARLDIPFVHISTDYVFDGSGEIPKNTVDPIAPLGVYGVTKAAGESAIRDAGGPHAILRTSWVVSAHGTNFVKTMLRLGAERDALSIVSDQIGGPTPAATIAQACVKIAQTLTKSPELCGTYHFSGAPNVSWSEFARCIFDEAGLSVKVSDIPSSDYPTPAERPKNSRMNNADTARAFGIEQPDWRAALPQIIAQIRAGS